MRLRSIKRHSEQLPMIFAFELPDNPTRQDYEVWLLSQIELMGEEFTTLLHSATTEIYWHNESVVDRACLIFEPLTETQRRSVQTGFEVEDHHSGCFDFFWVRLPQKKSVLTYEAPFAVGDTIRLNEGFWMSGKPYKSGGKMYNFPCVGDIGIIAEVFSDSSLYAHFDAGASGYFIISESECDLVRTAR